MLLGVDAGELPDETEELWLAFDWIHVACGGHAGDQASMARVARACEGRVQIGAHPSYPDRANFGRVSIEIDERDLRSSVEDQCRALAAVTRVAHVKPHGALYHDVARDPGKARAFLGGVLRAVGRVPVVGPPLGMLADAARDMRMTYLREGFADRRMRADGSLVPRGEPGASIADPVEAAAQATRLASEVDIICIHGDTPGALAIARAVRG